MLFEAAVSVAAGAIFKRCSQWLLVLVSSALGVHSEHHSATFRAPFSPHSKPVNEESGCTPVDAAHPVGRGMHGAVGDEAVHGWLKIRKMGLCGEPRERVDFQ